MKNTLIRINSTAEFPRPSYVKSLSRDGGFSITRDKSKARTFTPATARSLLTELPRVSRMTFDTCEAPNAQA